MTVKLLLLKSGEDIVADVKEMVVGEENNSRIVGYFLNKPCIVKMTQSNSECEDDWKKTSFRVTLYPWMPLTKDTTIPVGADWVVTIVNPSERLEKMYMEDVANHGTSNN